MMVCSGRKNQEDVLEKRDITENTEDMKKDDIHEIGFNHLCRYVSKSVERKYDVDKVESFKAASMLVDSIKSAKYMFSDLEDMYLGLMRHGQDTTMMTTELADTLAIQRKKFSSEVPALKLLKFAVEFFHHDPEVQQKLKPKKKDTEKKEPAKRPKSPSRSKSKETDKNLSKKFAKYENLRPLSNCLLNTLADEKVPHFKTKKIVGEIVDRIVTAGYNWDKILYFHTKNQDYFTKKLIPYFFMSKDELPPTLSPDTLLEKLYEFIDHSVKSFSTMMMEPSSVIEEKLRVKTSLLNHSKVNKIESKKRKVLQQSSSSSSDSDDSDSDVETKRPKKKKVKKSKSRTKSSTSMEEDVPTRRRTISEESPKNKTKETFHPVEVKQEVKSDNDSDASDASSNDLEKIINKSEDKLNQKQSLLEKVNEIIKSCVRLKDEKKISGSKLEKANKIIAKAEAKRLRLLKQESLERDAENEDCIEPLKADEIESMEVKEQVEEKNLDDMEEGEITDDGDDNEVTIEEEVKIDEDDKIKRKKKRKHRERKRTFSNDSFQGTVNDELQAMAGRDNRMTRMSLDQVDQERSRSRSTSWSPEHSYRKKAALALSGGRYGHHQYRHRSRTPSSCSEEGDGEMNRWIPITPCTIMEDVEVEPMSTVMVSIRAKGEFSFKDNPGCYVRITKWTGKDNVNFVVIKSQIVKLIESSQVKIEIGNPYPDKFLNIYKHDKIACMSILSTPPPSSLFSRLNCSPERYQSTDKRWFKVTTVVLHRKGSLDKISISPGKTLKVVGTVIGPLKKHIGRDVLISELDVGDPVPIQSQIARITDNEKIGVNISNRGRRTLIIEKTGQAIATVSVWANVGQDVSFFTKQRFSLQ